MPLANDRGMPPAKEAVWKHMAEKEDLMKLKWFHKNQQRLLADAEKATLRKGLSPEVLAEVEKLRQERYRNMERSPNLKGEEMELPDIDPNCILNIMRPVDPNTTSLLYKNMDKTGRRNYLNTRVKLQPIERFFFAETSSFVYGWDAFVQTKLCGTGKDFGRRQVIKNSFYRRNGLLKMDPAFYKEPQADSPTVCGGC